MSKQREWEERIPTLSIHGAQASERDVERLASELMEARARIVELEAQATILREALSLSLELPSSVPGGEK